MAFENFPDREDAYEEGYMAYVTGIGGNPYEQGTQDFKDWKGGWSDACLDDE